MFRAKHIKASPRVAYEDKCIRELEVFTPVKRELRDKLLNEVRSREWTTLFAADQFGFTLPPFGIVAGEFGYWASSNTWGAVYTRRNSFWSLLHWRVGISQWRCCFTNHFFVAASFGRTLEHHRRGTWTSLNSLEVDSLFLNRVGYVMNEYLERKGITKSPKLDDNKSIIMIHDTLDYNLFHPNVNDM